MTVIRHLCRMIQGTALVAVVSVVGMPCGAAEDIEDQQHSTAIAVRGTPVIDGEVDELWSQTPPVSINTPVGELLSVPATAAATAEARMLWDQTHLYFLLEVTDGAISTVNGSPWEQDSVEVFLDENLSRRRRYDGDDGQYRVSAKGMVTGSGKFDPRRVTAAVRAREGGYVVEMQLQPASLEPQAGLQLGLELQVNDDPGSGKRQAIMKWRDASDNSWRDTSRFGTLELKQEATAAELAAPPAAQTGRKQAAEPVAVDEDSQACVPSWAADAIFYQIFPERFCNGDPSNDPTRESLEFPDIVPDSWSISPWTGDWYARADWERALGEDFFDDGVFHRRYGGDLTGVINKLDYLVDLGINVIYFNPVFYARSLHKYDGSSFHHVDPYFGPDPQHDLRVMARETSDPTTWQWTAADRLFLDLVQAAHERGIRVIIDGVFNHTGRDFFAFEDVQHRQASSPYKSWYIVQSYDDPDTPQNEFRYKGWWGVETLPEFANAVDGVDLHPGPKQYIMAATRRWMDPNGDGDHADGIDGWRLDVANEVPDQFWVDWHRHVRAINPAAYTVSEIWTDASNYLRDCGFSATMNYHGFAFPVKGFLIDGTLSPSAFAEQLDQRRQEHYPCVQYALQNLLDSHDTDRLGSMIVNARGRTYLRPDRFDYDVGERVSPRHCPDYDVSKPDLEHRRIQRLAALFQMTYVGPPMIYYGTEAGMWGGDDPCDRMPMLWPEMEYEPQTSHPRDGQRPADPVEFDRDLFEFYRAIIGIRVRSTALRRGEFRTLLADDDARVFAFIRRQGDERLLVVLNRSSAEQRVTIPVPNATPRVSGWRQVFSSTGEVVSVNEATRRGELEVILPPLCGAILTPAAGASTEATP